MTTQDDDMQALAGEYVLGMLAGEERDRVERRMTGDARLRAYVEAWQVRLQPLVETVEPITPSPEAWQRIETTLGSPSALRQRRPLAATLRGPRWWQRINFWRGWAVGATMAAAGLAGWIVASLPMTPAPATPRLVAVLTSIGGEPFWLLSAGTPDQLAVHPVQEIARTAQAHELWLLPGADAAPISLGVLDPAADTRRPLPGDIASRLKPGAGVAVTLEPAGGSPTGAPTGPITYRGRLILDRI
jgi:anti-sigma-K factor RskA